MGASTSPSPAAAEVISVVWMHHTHVSGQSIVSAKGFVLTADWALNFDLACIVNGVLVPSKIVRSRKDGVAGLAG
jgi:hypothetical protein